jgi:predicted anti-sigma-YlaC factor YlaD
MKFLFRNCREVTELVLAGEDRRLAPIEQGAVWLHLKICKACPAFTRQVALMRQALPRWRAYRESQE